MSQLPCTTLVEGDEVKMDMKIEVYVQQRSKGEESALISKMLSLEYHLNAVSELLLKKQLFLFQSL